jgi:hypothetical protein
MNDAVAVGALCSSQSGGLSSLSLASFFSPWWYGWKTCADLEEDSPLGAGCKRIYL